MENPHSIVRERRPKSVKRWVIVICTCTVLAAGYAWFKLCYIQGRAALREEVLAQIDLKLLCEHYAAFEKQEGYIVNQGIGDTMEIYKTDMTDEKMKTEPLINIWLYGGNLAANKETRLSYGVKWFRPYWYWHGYPLEGPDGMYSSGIPNFTVNVAISDANGRIQMFIDPNNLEDGIRAVEDELLHIMDIARTHKL